MTKAKLIFVPTPGFGDLVSAVEFAKLLASRDDGLSITILVILPVKNDVAQNLRKDAVDNIDFVNLPALEEAIVKEAMSSPMLTFSYAEQQKTRVREVVTEILSRSDSTKLCGFLIDKFCAPLVDVANDFNVPAYAFYTTGAAFLGLQFYAQTLLDDGNKDISEYKDSDVELLVPSFANLFPAKYLPTVMVQKDWSDLFIKIARKLRDTKGIVVKTVLELEAHAIQSLAVDEEVPLIYHVGPVINFKRGEASVNQEPKNDEIIRWLDRQPPSSVVFLCFGSLGSTFKIDQVTEIARAMEQSGQRFLWSLRRHLQDYEDFSEVLPEGFLDRTLEIGKVIGWAPQLSVLSHPAVGGFVSHCGWKSILESLWCGVPVATWPMYAEQQSNAFNLVKELGLAVEIKMNHRDANFIRNEEQILVTADEIGRGIKCLMDEESEMRKKVREMSNICRKSTLEGGSSYASLGQFIEHVKNNIRECA